MTNWKQVSGDVDFNGVGCVLAKDNPESRDVKLVRITPWLEIDSSALKEGYGFWDVSISVIDYDDININVKNNNVLSALKNFGLDAEEYQTLDPSHKAAIVAEYTGYSESTSTSDFAEALPAPIEQVEFWSGSKNHDAESINDEMRREVTTKLYGGKFSSRKLPTNKALQLAHGDKPRTFELTEDEAQAVRYAVAVHSDKYPWPAPKNDDHTLVVPSWQKFASLLEVLHEAPTSLDLPAATLAKLQPAYEDTYNLNWNDKREQVAYLIDEDSKEALRLIDNLLGNLGF